MAQIKIREAIKGDLKAIKSLLKGASLPSVDIDKHLLNFLVLEKSGTLTGTIGMELYGNTALLRSLAIQKKFRNNGYGKELYYALISKAKNMSIISIYLLTETAEGFFSKEGFQKIEREQVPPSIKQTNEYSALCPEGAVCMVKMFNEVA